ncbi:asparagine synthase (glutamine-hydrolyzing) [Sulfobacillus harzensis]|uniref:asparagine synthase (glutamine-hydrolyzing) n=1 Tax=Sulfobacillus harzensis TaxID=2729629 RepID=A0A7Y0L4L2_9FIRM|nr:asparagine synthase (glutamine-hydrolyzing) [Sulfobacillus harzensis]NMP23234.1 asparagine synthase (glutamine-hydrolyzing) [Sulfobacillus harzensis]
MCGIAGWIDYQRNLVHEQRQLEAMAQPMTCRGPDGSGTWISPHAGLAHRRLVVIDPEGGMQPMSRRYGDTVYTIVYNGELYNFQELREELQALGYTFQSRSDTEVLLTAYMAWGENALERLNGIYAFAIWNSRTQTLFMARDRLGVKPLFYTKKGSTLLFASEIKGLLAHTLVSRRVNRDGLAEVFALGPSRTPGQGVFEDIEELRAGWSLVHTPTGTHTKPYWQLTALPHEDDLDTTAQKIHDLLQDAVERQLVADVPVVTLLSGGLDSSIVTAIASGAFRRQGKGRLKTFSIDFKDMERYFQDNGFQTNMDAPWVKRVSEHLDTEHIRVELDTPDLDRYLLPALRARDLPGHADVDTSLLVFAGHIKREATVGLSGEAADEIFGGYPWFHRPDALSAHTFPWSLRLKDRVSVLDDDFLHHIQPFDYVDARYQEALEEVPHLPDESPEEHRIREIAYLSITRFLPTLLDRKDRMTMAQSLEVRVPFCDHRLVDYVFNIPWEMKNYQGVAKGILRRAARGWLPEEVVMRRKSPYPSTPNPSYFAAMANRMLEIVNDPGAPLRPFINRQRLADVIKAGPQADQIPWFGQLMGNAQLFAFLIQANAWLDEYRIEIV